MADHRWAWRESGAGPFHGGPPGPRRAGWAGNHSRRARTPPAGNQRRSLGGPSPPAASAHPVLLRCPAAGTARHLALPPPTRLPPLPTPRLSRIFSPPARTANDKTAGKRTDDFNHFKAVAEAIQGLTWVVYQPNIGMSMPPAHVSECWQAHRPRPRPGAVPGPSTLLPLPPAYAACAVPVVPLPANKPPTPPRPARRRRSSTRTRC